MTGRQGCYEIALKAVRKATQIISPGMLEKETNSQSYGWGTATDAVQARNQSPFVDVVLLSNPSVASAHVERGVAPDN